MAFLVSESQGIRFWPGAKLVLGAVSKAAIGERQKQGWKKDVQWEKKQVLKIALRKGRAQRKKKKLRGRWS